MIKDASITQSISEGMYVVTTDGAGCIVDTVMQASTGDPARILVILNKKSFTHQKIHENKRFALSILDLDVDPKIIETFGFHSSRNYDKFAQVDCDDVDGLKIVKQSVGYIICELDQEIDSDTHTIFIGKMVGGDRFSNVDPMPYLYYFKNKATLMGPKPAASTQSDPATDAQTAATAQPTNPTAAEETIKAVDNKGRTAWVCTVCGYIYYGDEVPDDFKCPICGVGKEYFKKVEQ